MVDTKPPSYERSVALNANESSRNGERGLFWKLVGRGWLREQRLNVSAQSLVAPAGFGQKRRALCLCTRRRLTIQS